MKMNNVENKGKGKNIAIIALSIALIIALGFIFYYQILNKSKVERNVNVQHVKNVLIINQQMNQKKKKFVNQI